MVLKTNIHFSGITKMDLPRLFCIVALCATLLIKTAKRRGVGAFAEMTGVCLVGGHMAFPDARTVRPGVYFATTIAQLGF
jgi:hypothetical protein